VSASFREAFVERYLPVVRAYLSARWKGRLSRSELEDAVQYSANWSDYLASSAYAHAWMLSHLPAWSEVSFPGFVTRNEENAPAWFETLTTRYDEVVAFYRDAFGWETHVMGDAPEFRYTTLGLNENARAGIMDATHFLGDEPARWQFYLQVADTDETIAKAVSIGAEVVAAADDTPYGRIATMTDPAGIPFCVLGPNLEAS